ncbi:MAG: SOS response-associated peptidase [Edaphobacter sp.]|uniref:SOS response-associated peptidase n=1 Tax=Edaphobacter sp. TaxID=1934404 RepID=UPI0023913B14|nr:SOS response-associated peptidase [Edaphobacter sp.]MDE1178481.1 SOS response-associated peptidase [Edaphobacter sp.]
MCGRYYRRSDKKAIAEAFGLKGLAADFVLPPWDFNVAPTTFQPVIRNARDTGEPELVLMRWGLVPYAAKSLAEYKGISTINAKAETLMERAMWRVPFERRRCLIPADGFYEWKAVHGEEAGETKTKGKASKQPYGFSLKSDQLFAFGGVWDAWKDPATGEWLQSFAIITVEPNVLTATVHDRMPLIIAPEDYARWLDRGSAEPPLDLLRSYPAEEMRARKVKKDVGSTKNNSPDLADGEG